MEFLVTQMTAKHLVKGKKSTVEPPVGRHVNLRMEF